jgi:hypothetical protein
MATKLGTFVSASSEEEISFPNSNTGSFRSDLHELDKFTAGNEYRSSYRAGLKIKGSYSLTEIF